ncbi:MAG: hypothetical protein ACTSV0_03875 [Candidatus Freyarchaeota archaeon]
MSEWLGKREIKKEDLSEWLKDLKFFNSVARWFTQINLPHIVVVVPEEHIEGLVEKVEREYGKVSAGTLKRAALDALIEWIKK